MTTAATKTAPKKAAPKKRAPRKTAAPAEQLAVQVAEPPHHENPADAPHETPAEESLAALAKLSPQTRAALKLGPEVQEWDDEWLVRRGNYITLITPELAAKLLERNHNNRRLKERAIAKYMEEMKAGRWDPDASDLKFARNGNLLDGQNRLTAAIRAGVSFATLVRTGLKQETRNRVDLGVRRTVSDSFRMEGIQWATNTAAAITLRLRYEEGEATGAKVSAERRVQLSPDQALEYAAAHPMHEKMTTLADSMYRVGPSIARTVYFAFLPMAAERDESAATAFAESFINGDIGGLGNPLLAFMRYVALAKAPGETGKRSRNVNERHLLALAKTWNAWRTGSPVDRLVVRDHEPLVPLA